MEEYTLLEVSKTFSKVFTILKKNLIIIFLLLTVSGIIGFFYARSTQASYISESTIMLDNESQGGGIRGLASELGFGSKLGVNEEKLIRIILSREVIMECVKNKISINGKEDFIANQVLKNFYAEFGLEGGKFIDINWNDSEKLTIEDSLIYKAGSIVLKKNINATEEKDGTINIITTFHNPNLSYEFNVRVLEGIKQYFITSELGKERVTISVLETRADSIYHQLLKTEQELAEHQDQNLKTIKAVGALKEFKLRRKLSINNILYTEVIKNLELARFNLLNKKSSIHIIDNPSFPEENKMSTGFGIFVGFLIGAFLSVIVVFLKEVKVNAIQEF
jgi:capsular polysaccharide biosynthesis protein